MAVWITGAGSGIGKALAIKFATENVVTIISSRSEEKLKSIYDNIGIKKDYLRIVPIDLLDYENLERVSSQIVKDHDIDCLINNAGITSFNPALNDSDIDIKNIMDVNYYAPVVMMRKLLPQMILRKEGKIINILSVAAKKIFTRSSAYAASKAALLAYANVLREELRENNIKIINLLPGATNTSIWPESVVLKNKERMMKPEDLAAFIFQIYELNSNMVPEEVILKPVTGDL